MSRFTINAQNVLNLNQRSHGDVGILGCRSHSMIFTNGITGMFENMVFRRIFGPRRDDVTGEWRGLHKEELNDLYCSPNIVRVIKSR